MGAGDRGGDAYGERIAQAAREEGGVHWSVTWDAHPGPGAVPADREPVRSGGKNLAYLNKTISI